MLGLALVTLMSSQPAMTAASESTIGPVYGGTFTWTTPALTVVPPTGNGFLGVTTFRGRFVAVERNGVASTSIDGATWVGHALPGRNGGGNPTLIAAGTNRVAIIGQGAGWTSPDGDAWTAASAPPPGPAQPSAMTALADGFVAVGIAPGGRRAAAWMSTDGSIWMASPDQPAFDHFCPTAVAASPTGRVVAVGNNCYPYLARPAAAISDDGGLTWRRAPAQTQLAEEGRLTAVVAGGPGFVAAGRDTRDVYPGWPQGVAMFVSADGLTWRRVGYFEGGSGRSGPFLSVIPGGYLAVDTSSARPAAFVSVDGLDWTQSTSLPATPHATNDDFADAINGLAVNGNAIVGVGTTDHVLFVDAPRDGAFTIVGTLTSRPTVTGMVPLPPAIPTPRPPSVPVQPSFPGKVSWAVRNLPVTAPPGAAVAHSGVGSVTRWQAGFAAVGSEWFESESFGPSIPGRDVVWTSPDGAQWTEHPLPSDCTGRIATTRTAIVVAGDGGICRSLDGVTWTRVTDTPAQVRDVVDVIAGGPGFILVMSPSNATTVSVRVWRSADGLHWRSAGGPAAFSNLDPLAVAAGPRGIVILGQRYIRGFGYDSTFLPLRSRDGVTWARGLRQRAFEPLSFDAGAPTRPSMISGGPGYIAAGSYQPRSRTGAAVWTSPDGLAWKRVYFTLPSSGFMEFDGLARIGPGYAVVGLLAPPSQEDPASPTVWLSPDGTHWRSGVSLPLPTDGPIDWVQITGGAGGSARLVAVGSLSGAGRSQAVVWTGTYRAP
jgi:hypothetical protein